MVWRNDSAKPFNQLTFCMKSDINKTSIWKRLRHTYRISIINEKTLSEHGHLRVSVWGGIILLAIVFLLSWLLFSLVIAFTPMRNYLPGYSGNIRHQLMEESAKIDSMGTNLELQRQYLNVITQAIAGEMPTDSIQSLDSMQIIAKEELLTTKSKNEEDFIAQYEANEKDNLQLFEAVISANTSHTNNFIAPTHGAITQTFSPTNNQYGVTISTYSSKSAVAVLDGTIIHNAYEINNTYSVIIQHAQFTSIYQGLEQPTKQIGDNVTVGQVIGLIKDQKLQFQLWQNGKPVNPQDYIVF